MKRFEVAALMIALVALVSAVRAEDEKPNPTGTWKWEVKFNDQTREMTLKLKLDGDKLTGSMVGRNGLETEIEDAKFADGEVTFTVTRMRNDQKFVTKYNGKVSGDTIKGKSESERNGEKVSRDWEAKRAKE
jgi:hypothetical protein